MSIIHIIKNNKLVVISKRGCHNCLKLKQLLGSKKITYETIHLENFMEMYDGDELILEEIDSLKKAWNIMSFPMTFIDNAFIGHYKDIEKMNVFSEFDDMLLKKNVLFENNDDKDF